MTPDNSIIWSLLLYLIQTHNNIRARLRDLCGGLDYLREVFGRERLYPSGKSRSSHLTAQGSNLVYTISFHVCGLHVHMCGLSSHVCCPLMCVGSFDSQAPRSGYQKEEIRVNGQQWQNQEPSPIFKNALIYFVIEMYFFYVALPRILFLTLWPLQEGTIGSILLVNLVINLASTSSCLLAMWCNEFSYEPKFTEVPLFRPRPSLGKLKFSFKKLPRFTKLPLNNESGFPISILCFIRSTFTNHVKSPYNM